ncbi:DUF262 domain-containing protein [Myroides marinus]|uniref:DUF262 domain-containing protein n=1 Tax=Myroides marinus TaxID=703342 RepID=UPI002574DF82|nr:DUF262 domain-containing protein [Myroides marinus]MDM1405308.1 DUF262 domain-containing protein [Myroides marinus]
MGHTIETFNVHELFSSDHYRIPIYQRNYAWGKEEISQLLQDIIDYSTISDKYYIGTLVVYKQSVDGKVFYDTIDGQQRLTTLSIILSVLKNKYKEVFWYKKGILSFESRILSQNALDFAFNGEFNSTKEYHNTIKEAYDFISLELNNVLVDSSLDIKGFIKFFLESVTLLRVEVPQDTDLNHYFEIMNNRGEQLEKHEIVKARLLDCLYDEDDELNKEIQELFNTVWEAVSNMERYVQYGFEPKLRKALFGKDWSSLIVGDYEELIDEFLFFKENNRGSKEEEELSIDDIIRQGAENVNAEKEETPDRFTSPINFQNFLLHILLIKTKNEDIKLDDKRLIDFFEMVIPKSKNKKKAFALEFMYDLLTGKYLLDRYVIKRQYLANKEGWSLLTLISKDKKKGYYINTFEHQKSLPNETIIMLLSMFHVSTPTMIYKHWLNATLYFLFNEFESNVDKNNNIDVDTYIYYLEKIAKQLLSFRFLNEGKDMDYYTLIYNNDSLPEVYEEIEKDNKNLRYGMIKNNLVFNILDYIIWYNDRENKFSSFEFTFRSSVEHYYPQNPIGGEELDTKYLHSFGNLCLISHQKNSKLNYHLPTAKKNYYNKLEHGGQLNYDSLKQYTMMNDYDADTWGEKDIVDHNKKMIDMINEFMQN